jgi:asparagine synthase (glutamine-hydrolysing)
VVLTGEGADELFGGYIPLVSEYLREPDHSWPHGILHSDDKIRQELLVPRQAASNAWFQSFGASESGALGSLSPRQLNGLEMPSGFLVFRPPVTTFSSWVQHIYRNLNPKDTSTDNLDGRAKEFIRSKWHPLHSAFYVWIKAGLVNNLLSCLGDRVEMAHSVEARTPFLDHHLSEYVNSLPPSVKVRCVVDETGVGNGGEAEDQEKEKDASKTYGLNEKWILKEATRPYITDEIYKRRKHAFTAPASYLAGGPLHALMQKILAKENVKQLGFLDWEVVQSYLEQAFPTEAGQGVVSSHVLRSVFMSAQFVTLGKRFGVEKADPEIRV